MDRRGESPHIRRSRTFSHTSSQSSSHSDTLTSAQHPDDNSTVGSSIPHDISDRFSTASIPSSRSTHSLLGGESLSVSMTSVATTTSGTLEELTQQLYDMRQAQIVRDDKTKAQDMTITSLQNEIQTQNKRIETQNTVISSMQDKIQTQETAMEAIRIELADLKQEKEKTNAMHIPQQTEQYISQRIISNQSDDRSPDSQLENIENDHKSGSVHKQKKAEANTRNGKLNNGQQQELEALKPNSAKVDHTFVEQSICFTASKRQKQETQRCASQAITRRATMKAVACERMAMGRKRFKPMNRSRNKLLFQPRYRQF